MQNRSRLVPITLAIALIVSYLPCPAAAQLVPVGLGERIYVLGAVNNPGDFEFKPGMGAKEALELAGGLAPNADPKGGVLVRANNEKVALNLNAILEGKETVQLGPGDTIVVKPAAVVVTGQVKKPGAFDFKPGMTAADLLALAGGLTETAAPAAAYITRDGKTVNVNLADPSAMAALEPGDVLTVPELSASITGEVVQPGTYTLIAGKTDNLEGLLEKAGGPTPRADLKKVRLTTTRDTDRPTKTVDASSRATRQAMKIERGDAVFVPQAEVRHRHRVTLSEVYQATLIVYTLIQIFRR